MCGIFGFFNLGHDSFHLSPIVLDCVGKKLQARGSDGWGIESNLGRFQNHKNESFSISGKTEEEFSWLMLNCRAKPETEFDSDVDNMQPVTVERSSKYSLVHNGAISEKYVKEVFGEYNFEPKTNIDSEALLCSVAYNWENTKDVLEKIDGGFSYIAFETYKGKLKSVNVGCKYQPLYIMEATHGGNYHGIFISSIRQILEDLKIYIDADNICIKEFKEYSNTIWNIENNASRSQEFMPLYNYPNRAKETDKIKVLCACSGGIDSTTSLIMAHKILRQNEVPYEIEAVHFKYGHRGEEAEEHAIKNIILWCNTHGYQTKLTIVDLSKIYQNVFAVKNSQLINKNSEIETGTQDGLKSTIAWVPVRNMMFQTILFGIGETNILEEGFKSVYMVAGWNQLSEEGFYPDNSARFSNAMLKASTFGTLVGKKFYNWNLCSNLLKSDQWLLAHEFNFLDAFKYTISCDIPVESNGNYYNCNGQCGSTLLSMWASKRYKGIKDPRQFKEAVTTIRKEDLYEEPECNILEINQKVLDGVMNRLQMINGLELKYEK